MQYRLRTLLVMLAVGPMVLAAAWFLAQTPLGLGLLALLVYFIASFFLAPVERYRID